MEASSKLQEKMKHFFPGPELGLGTVRVKILTSFRAFHEKVLSEELST